MAATPPARLFIGSSSEGSDVARHLQEVLEGRQVCEVDVWDTSVFEPSGYALDSLLVVAARTDFAVLVASPDDETTSRGDTAPSVRDNIVLEFGLFLGALGRQRTYLLATGPVKLPTDVFGLTRLPYRARSDGNLSAALNAAALQIAQQVRTLGRRDVNGPSAVDTRTGSEPLEAEITRLRTNAEAQGWTVKTDSATTLRLLSPRGKYHTLTKSKPESTRADLRRFAAELRADGLRVNHAIRRPVEESPY
ncbi:nucleotide-binding protein [Kineococcus sp. SYSU DK003]|uniref:nucleotide-binding protein n=1 Tax=Kineococcus sp. SYSU DK003 TaxID=3383124 RepID=UPI003D7C653B